MPTYAWVALGMLIAGIGGALATWVSMLWMDRGFEPQPAEVLRNLTALGGVLAGLCGGVASIGRGRKGDRTDYSSGLAAIGLGIGVVALINPGFLFAPVLLVLAPLQGLTALLGGLAALAAFWSVLGLAGIRAEFDLATPFRGALKSPLRKIGLIAMAAGVVLPLLPYLGDSPAMSVLSSLSISGGIWLCAASLLLDGLSRFRRRAGNAVAPSDAANDEAGDAAGERASHGPG